MNVWMHIRLNTLPSPLSHSPWSYTLPHPGECPTVTHIPSFITALKKMSQWHITAWPVSAKKQLYTTCSRYMVVPYSVPNFIWNWRRFFSLSNDKESSPEPILLWGCFSPFIYEARFKLQKTKNWTTQILRQRVGLGGLKGHTLSDFSDRWKIIWFRHWICSSPEVPNHQDRSRYRDLKKVQAGPEKLPKWYISLSFDATWDQNCLKFLFIIWDLRPKRLGTTILA